jgi:hypothetical protein
MRIKEFSLSFSRCMRLFIFIQTYLTWDSQKTYIELTKLKRKQTKKKLYCYTFKYCFFKLYLILNFVQFYKRMQLISKMNYKWILSKKCEFMKKASFWKQFIKPVNLRTQLPPKNPSFSFMKVLKLAFMKLPGI